MKVKPGLVIEIKRETPFDQFNSIEKEVIHSVSKKYIKCEIGKFSRLNGVCKDNVSLWWENHR